MACRKCGSSWTTIHGADTASCPYCCKVQRCKARKNGRLPPGIDAAILKSLTTECMWCKSQFSAKSTRAHRKFCSSQCYELHRKEYLAQRRREIKAGSWNVDSGRQSKSEHRQCLACGKKLASGQKKYCSRSCFFSARTSGKQPWDRSAIETAARSRPSNTSQSPGMYAARSGAKERESFLRAVRRMWRRASRKQARIPGEIAAARFALFVSSLPKLLTCKLCGDQCVKPARWKLPHCSMECARKDVTHAVCTSCNRPMKIHFIGGNVEARKAAPVCNRCVLNRHKKLCGCFRRRCRKYGVPYDPKVTRPAVFKRDSYRCHICKKKTLTKYVVRCGRAHPMSPTVDHHPYPLSVGIKGHEWDNVRCACLRCNVRKGASWSGQMLLFC